MISSCSVRIFLLGLFMVKVKFLFSDKHTLQKHRKKDYDGQGKTEREKNEIRVNEVAKARKKSSFSNISCRLVNTGKA